MELQIKIEDGIPIPEYHRGVPKSDMRKAMEKMAVGQSFEIPRAAYKLESVLRMAKNAMFTGKKYGGLEIWDCGKKKP